MMSPEISIYNLVYKIIDDHSYVISYASVSMAGGMTFGIYGVIVGLGAVALNDFLIYNNYIKDKNIIQSFIGFTLGYNVYPSYVVALIGSIGSIFVTQDMLKDNSNSLTNILANTVLGMKLNGSPGAFTGVIFSVIDQTILHSNITDKFYLSHGLLGMVSISVVFGKSAVVSFVGVTLGLIVANCRNTTDSIFRPIEASKDLYNIYSKIIPKEKLDQYVNNYAIVLLSSQIIMSQLKVILLKHQQNYVYQFEHMDSLNDNPINKLNTVTIKFTLFILPYVITEFVSNIINSFYITKLYIEVDDVLRNMLFTNETALKLYKNKINIPLIDNLKFDSKVISHDGSKLIVDSIAKSIKGIHGIGVLFINVPEILVYSVLYNKATEYIFATLVDWQNQYEILIKNQESIISTLFKHDMSNIKIITETGGILYSYKQHQALYNELRKNEFIRDQISQTINAWKSLESITNFFSIYYVIGYKVGTGTIGFDNRINMHYSCLTVSKLLGWNGDKASETKIIYQSLERLNRFINQTFSDEGKNIENVDNIKREQFLHYEKIVISNLNIIVANKKLIYIDYLELNFGNSYVITGPSGSGKSSFVTKIVGAINNNIGGEGYIYYPQNIKITLISQQIYFPLQKSLQEIIFYPQEVNVTKRQLLEELLTRVDLLQYKLDQIEDWYSVLSGGQKQKIRIISAIIQEPNVLILDEVFNGLDKNSIDLMQSIIKEMLPNILIISIDHNVLENNRTGFYSTSLEVVDGELINNNIDQNQYIQYDSFEDIINYNQKCYKYDNDNSYYEYS